MSVTLIIFLITFVAGGAAWAYFSAVNYRQWQQTKTAPIVAGAFRTNTILGGALALVCSFWVLAFSLPTIAPSVADSPLYIGAMTAAIALLTLPPALMAHRSFSAMKRGEAPDGYQWAIMPLAVSMAVAAGLAFVAAVNSEPPPPFTYIGEVDDLGVIRYEAENPILCPGDELRYTPTIEINKVGRNIDLRQAIYDLDAGGTIWSADIGLVTQELTRTSNQIPIRLPTTGLLRPNAWQAGHRYQYMSSPSTGDVYAVTFEIADDCD